MLGPLKAALGIFFSIDTVEPFHEGQGARLNNVLDAELRTNREWRHYDKPSEILGNTGKTAVFIKRLDECGHFPADFESVSKTYQH